MIRPRTIWQVYLCLFTAGFAAAQNQSGAPPAVSAPPALAALEQTVKDRTVEWNRLAQSLEGSLVRLLPCDPKIAASITEVTKASDARTAAIAAYLDAANRQAQLQAGAAKQVLASLQGLDVDLAAEKSDLAPERAGLDGQLANLSQSVQHRASLAAPQDGLKQIVALQQQRSDAVDAAVSHADASATDLADVVMQLQARQAALNELQTAFGTEAARWSAYYATRLARAQTECSISKGVEPAAAPPAGKRAGKGRKQ